MAALADVFLRGRLDTTQIKGDAERGLNQANLGKLGEQHGKAFGGSFAKVAGGLVAGVGGLLAGLGIAEAFRKTIGGASDLNETLSKTQQVFKGSSAEIIAWSKTAATSMGLSQRAALDGASSFQNLFSQIGLTGKVASGMSTNLVKLASDFASFHNAKPEEVMDALLSATRGEYDALQRFVPTVTAATIQTRALADSHKTAAATLTAAEKATALYELVVEGAGAATGDFARTSTGAANQQRILQAKFEDSAAAVGKSLLPAYQTLLTVLTGQLLPGIVSIIERIKAIVGWFQEHAAVTWTLVGVLGSLAVIYGVTSAALAIQAGGLIAYLSLTNAVKVATAAWTAAQWLLNTAMAANPIGIVIVVIVALVAAIVLAYQHSETFRKIVDGALRAVAEAGRWMWQNVLQPVFQAWLFYIQNFLIPIILFLWHNVVEPAFAAIAFAVKVAWAIISVIFNIWVAIIRNVIGPAVLWLWQNVVGPAFNAMGNIIANVWNSVIRPVFEALGRFIRDTVAPAFRAGVDAIQAAWNRVRDAAASPVRFVIDTVINKGIIGTFNKVAGFFGAKGVDTVPVPFAQGGPVMGPGTGTSDSIWARLSNGEYVVPAKTVRKIGVGFFDSLIGRPSRKRPGDGSEGIAFATGGLVDLLNVITNPVKWLGDQVLGLADRVPGGSLVRGIAGGMTTKLVAAAAKWITGQVGAGNAGGAMAFLRGQVGKPYIWASAGPAGYDCSGIVSAVWNVLHGKNPYQHTFSTMNEAPYFPLGGAGGILSAGWSNAGERGGGSVGHTAGLLAGVPFESTGGVGVRIGAGVTPLSAFAHVGHFDRGGAWPSGTLGWNGSGRTEHVATGATMDAVVGRLDALIAAVDRVAPGVGAEIHGGSLALRRTARMRS